MLLVGEVNRKRVFFSQQILQDFAALNPPHTFLFQLSTLLPHHANIIPQFILLLSQHFQPRYNLFIPLIHSIDPHFVHRRAPEAKSLQHTFLDTIREDVQGHHDGHFIFLLVLAVYLAELL